ncbi:hypothetical protein Lal_00031924 [Lupinus albus]|uniref:Putative pectinesterase inhibitor domain-containing protein n=1 Tax=Lupinus albus TaxID=3870 RepID=A0A6A5P6J2_LUPAL|nr:putative pectinesterase inhibitor domain-containing protein [Lupinus albus]KAF1892652.1 hypothetical protein Lal_00031924 [Lupinus albus]
MKTLNSLTLIFFLQAMLFIFMITIPSSHSITFHPNNNNDLIENICSTAPYYDICIRILTSGSPTADIWGLSVLMVNDMEAKAKEALAKINELQRSGTGSKTSLDSCLKEYNAILEDDIPKAREALQKRDAKISEGALNDVVNEATKCETDFPGYLTEQNTVMHDVAADTIHIFKLLHS